MIRKIHLKNFTVHEDLEVELDEAGLLVVRGKNGAGKTACIEAIAWALWGKTIRGTAPYSDDKSCEVYLEAGDFSIKRTRDKGKTTVSYTYKGEDFEFQTASKAKESIEAIAGTYEVWRQTCVLTSVDTSQFTCSPDKDRKAILESILDLGQFDVALKACTQDLARLANEASDTEYSIKSLASGIAAEQRIIDGADREIKEYTKYRQASEVLAEGKPVKAKLEVLEKEIVEAEGEISVLAQEEAEHAKVVAVAKDRKAQADKKLARLGDKVCPVCEQEVSDSVREHFAFHEKVPGPFPKRDLLDRLRAELSAKKAKYRKLESQLSELRAELKTAKSIDELRQNSESRRDEAAAKICELQISCDKSQAILESLQKEQKILEFTKKALGHKGIRALVLDGALSAIEVLTNQWLEVLSEGKISVKFTSYSETKSGSVTNNIGIDVLGAGGGRGYRAASLGERRRIDIAILLALSQFKKIESPISGTYLMDEVFDSIDETGITKICEMLETISREHQVVVITHEQNIFDDTEHKTLTLGEN